MSVDLPGPDVESDAAAAVFAPLSFDPRDYMRYVRDQNLTEAQAVELLGAIWSIVVAFVDLGFGISPLQQAMDKSGDGSGISFVPPATLVGLSGSFSNSANGTAATGQQDRGAG
jgi:hypothetical protein